MNDERFPQIEFDFDILEDSHCYDPFDDPDSVLSPLDPQRSDFLDGDVFDEVFLDF